MKRAVVAGLLVSLSALTWTGLQARADDEKENRQLAAEIVSQALQAEVDGDLLTRKRLLAEAVELSHDFEPAKWYNGVILENDRQWRSIGESIAHHRDDKGLDQYEQQRSVLPNTVEGHWDMAVWCAKKRLFEQSAAHLQRIIQIDPQHIAARTALGHQPIGDDWISLQEMLEMAERAQWARESMERYGAQVSRLMQRVLTSPERSRGKFQEELMNLRDPLAVPAVESVASAMGDQAVKLSLEWFSVIDSPAASQSMARVALLHPTAAIRQSALKQLKQKPVYDYVPELLTLMSGPVNFMAVPTFDRDGNFTGYRQAFAKEGMNEHNIQITDRTFQRVLATRAVVETSPSGRERVGLRGPANFMGGMLAPWTSVEDAVDAILRERMVNQLTQLAAANEVAQRQAAAMQENQAIQDRNERISQVISYISGEELPADPKEVWQWWDKYNETNYQAYKPERYKRNSLSLRVPQYVTTHECFVAGTPVMTQRGMRPIDQVVVGDMALSRNVSTGKLCWMPVIANTFQPPAKTVTITAGKDKLTCTLGHLLWVSGSGWKKASEIKTGDLLHTAAAPATVLATTAAEDQPTYNLEILDNHTYFVGHNHILSHDVTPRQSTRAIIPGFMGAESAIDTTDSLLDSAKNP